MKSKYEDDLRNLQSWTNNTPLVVLGSGATVSLGLPSMWTLGEHLKNTIAFTEKEDQELFQNFKDKLEATEDLERALSEIQLSANILAKIIRATWELVNQKDHLAYEELIKNGVSPLSELISHLINNSQRKATIITTNYDRCAEYAASQAKAIICNGYTQNYIGQFSNKIQTNHQLSNLIGYNGQVNIWKVHGSLDWFKEGDSSSVQLPLRKEIPTGLTPAIVTPGLSKYLETQMEPFRTIFTEADNEIESATGFVCIGYGFNDIHVQPKLLAQIALGKPIIVLTKELTDKCKDAIINGTCDNYILMEDAGDDDTRVYTPEHIDGYVLKGCSHWDLGNYLNLIKS